MKSNSVYPSRINIISLLILIVSVFNGCSNSTSTGTVGTVTPFSYNSTDVSGGIFKHTSSPGGKTYAEWSVAWWQWAYGTPATNPPGTIYNPMLDTNGSQANIGAQSSLSVFFLGGLLTKSATAFNITRTVTIPKEYAIFFPVTAIIEDSVVAGTTNTGTMNTNISNFIGNINDQNVKLDGAVIFTPLIAQSYRTTSAQFSYSLPVNNIYQYFFSSAATGTMSPALADGYYVFIPPLAIGKHTLIFNSNTTVNGISKQMTYNITTN